MNRRWDRPWEEVETEDSEDAAESKALEQVQAMQAWHLRWLQEALRILKPGGMIKAFSGTRTYHRLAAAMQEAGFQDIHIESWNFGSGFPKSLNVFKALQQHFEKEGLPMPEEAKEFDGYGTALKPAWECFLVGMKLE